MRHLPIKAFTDSKETHLRSRMSLDFVWPNQDRATSRWPPSRLRPSDHGRYGSDQYLRQILDSCSANVVVFNEAGKVVHANRSWREFAAANGLAADHNFGFNSLRRSQETTGIFTGTSIRFLDDIQWLINTKQQNFEKEYILRGSTGLKILLTRASRVDKQNAAEKNVRIVATVEDVTQRRAVEDEIQDLSGRLIKAQELERSRIARELHDHVNQQLAVLSIELEQLRRAIPMDRSDLCSNVRSVLSRSRELASDVHRLSYQLHPFKLDHLGLSAALKSLCAELSSHHDIQIKFRQQGLATLPADITLCLFRIAQESLSNIVKHSGVSRASVILAMSENVVRLRMVDRGCGFDLESPKVKQRLGLTSMKERLRLVGGELSIQSQPGAGTKVDAFVPLTNEIESDIDWLELAAQHVGKGGIRD